MEALVNELDKAIESEDWKSVESIVEQIENFSE